MEVSFTTKKYQGPVRKTVTVVSSDAEQANFPLMFSAIIGGMPPTVGVSPETGIDFDRFTADEHKEARVTLANYSPDQVTISIVGTPPDYMEAKLTKDKLEPRQTAELVVSTTKAAPLGKFTGAITVSLVGSQTTRLTIPVTGVSMMK